MQENKFQQYVKPFVELLSTVESGKISSDVQYVQYLQHLLTHKEYYLQIYADMLEKVCEFLPKEKQQAVLIDVGAGNGILGIFAKYCGFKEVYANDTETFFLEGIEKLSAFLQIKIDGYLHGSLEDSDIKSFTSQPDAFVGSDVIEHIYDLKQFVKTISSLNPHSVCAFTTGSNPENYLKVKALQKLQRRDELQGYTGEEVDSSKHEAFLKMREEIITEEHKDLINIDLHLLAHATRGLNKKDIISAVKAFDNTGELPTPAAGYNTCNPLTGSWSEKIISIEDYKSIFRREGFALKVYEGFYDSKKTGFMKYINRGRNLLVKLLGMRVAPFITIISYKNK